MGSIWSKAGHEPQDNRPPPAVGNVREREADPRHAEERPNKRQRKSKQQRVLERAIPPPTRAMQKHGNADGSKVQKRPEPHVDLEIGNHHRVKQLSLAKKRKKKVAVFLGYVGEKYHGMQVNPGVVTIEQLLISAFYKAGLISDSNKESMSKIGWMRAARTDKGVSAAGQCVSAKLECEINNAIDPTVADAINEHLPEDVEIYGLLRTTGAFNARTDCHRRRYEYILPVRLLGGRNGVEKEKAPGAGDPRAARLSSILKRYEGTHSFANFTDGLNGTDDQARRYMINVRCGQPFLPPNSGVYYVVIEVFGQSFVLHQIRKMVGLALYVYLGHAPEETIPVALCPHVKIPTPMAPALGLLLDSLLFDNYNSRFEQVLTDGPVSLNAFASSHQSFKVSRIYKQIAEKERMDRILENWVKTCQHKLQYGFDEISELHSKFILSDKGREEQRKAHIASLYPIKTNEADFLGSADEEMARLASTLRTDFNSRYGTNATFLARAPGRVILIGEHLDYNGLPVVAIATTQGTMIAGCLDDTEYVEVQHLEDGKYTAGELRSNGLRVASDTGEESQVLDADWLQYVSWGVKALVGSLNTGKRTVKGGGRLLIGGDLPRAGGLASSSSLVTASALAAARLNRKRVPKKELALLAAHGERVGAGTRGGAVDHTTSMCASRGTALEISFTPHIGTRELNIPRSASIFAVDSGVIAEKGFNEDVKKQFNMRAAECRIGAALIARRLDVHLSKSVTTPGQLLFQARKTSALNCKSAGALRARAETVMEPTEVISLDEVRKELDVTEVELQNRFVVGVKADSFQVGKRMAHVFSETLRVERLASVVMDDNLTDAGKMDIMGQILNDGHASLREQFESSCSEVDELVEFCLESGALGSRMTGAGWGGYTVNLVPCSRVASFLKAVIERVGDAAVVEVSPASGGCIFAIHSSYGTRGRDTKKRERDMANGAIKPET